MDRCRICDSWKLNDTKTVIMENEFLKVTILVDYGAKIYEFIYKPSDRDFMYHNPRVEIRQPVFAQNVDDWWTGGLDEVIPTGHACTYKGQEYPYLGELWSLKWYYNIVKSQDDEVTVHLWRPTIIAPLMVEKWITLRKGEKILNIHHKVTNLDYFDFDFLWGIHPGFSINSNCRIDIPAEDMYIQESLPDNRLGGKGTAYKWPYATDKNGTRIDMRTVKGPEDGTCEFHYATRITDGWIALTDMRAKEGIGLVFPKNIFSVIWLWLVYGGWRGMYTACVEAWSGYPAKLTEAIKEGRFTKLQAGQSIECDTKILIYTGLSMVSNITLDDGSMMPTIS